MSIFSDKRFLAAVGLGGAAAAAVLARFAITSHGSNPWTMQGALNMLRIRAHIDAAVRLVDGRLSSAYRSPRVNKIVGGADNSRHMMGLAADIVPSGNLEAAHNLMWQAAKRGELGPVRKVLIEPGWIHIDWRKVGESVPMQKLVLTSTTPKLAWRVDDTA